MKEHETSKKHAEHRAPGEIKEEVRHAVFTYLIGLSLAGLLTALGFWVVVTDQIWKQSVYVWLSVFGVAQIGVHLVFFLHLTTGKDNTDNLIAVIFGLLIVFLFGLGTMWIMNNLNANMKLSMPEKANLHSSYYHKKLDKNRTIRKTKTAYALIQSNIDYTK